LIVVERYEWRQIDPEGNLGGGPQIHKFKTGVIDVYDVKTGTLIQAKVLEPPPGFFARVVGFSPDGKFMYSYAQNNLYAVSLLDNKNPMVIQLTEEDGFWPVAIFFSDK